MLAGVCLLLNDPHEKAGGGDISELLQNIARLTDIIELEVHEAVLSCARGRKQMAYALPVIKPVFH